ncbi:hypothetical protein EPA93_28705 [Ktedonosporobacter rubrisoli]|uniref:Uncharacterized protein n=1 Tax=Ktedonosporobacter rubrisoli TaxID=2509675 RepID=A0A4P6JW18_KTERU|nr:hypothetical protein [Ktedonosporobacter rubrisoli]QBD79744.1 hypothetical protein EPA93_28705 [Ktedonosporobacter rubrisoli]
MKKVMLILASVIGVIGIIHISLTPFLYKGLTLDGLWFACAGLALILLTFLNYTRLTMTEKQSQLFVLCHIANILTVVMIGLILMHLFAPHVLLLFVLLVLQTILLIRYQFVAYPSVQSEGGQERSGKLVS